jgi:hypothetical protein
VDKRERTRKNKLTFIESREFPMPIQLNEENSGKVLAIHVSGKLVKADYGHFVPEFERRVRQHGKVRVLDKKWQHGTTGKNA